jgi:hypothetical protein
VIRYGGSYMRYSGQKIPMYLFLLDYFIVFMAGLLTAVGIFAIGFATKVTYSFCLKASSHIKND